MYLLSFIAGLLATLTINVFPLLIIYFILFEKLANSKRGYIKNVVRFIVILNITFLITGTAFYKMGRFEKLRIDKVLQYIYVLDFTTILFCIWHITRMVIKKSVPYIDTLFLWLGVPLLSIILFVASFSALGPFYGNLIIANVNYITPIVIIPLSLCFSIGLTIPFAIVLFLGKHIYPKVIEKKWWMALQIAVGVSMIFIVVKPYFT